MKARIKTIAVNITISRRTLIAQKGKREYAALTIHDATQKEVIEFVKTTINSLGLPIVREGYTTATSIQVRMRNGRETIGKAVNLSFWGLSPVKTKEILLKHLA